MEIKEFIEKFESASLPKEEWNHWGHLRLALYYLYNEKTKHAAITKIRCGLIRYAVLTNPDYNCSERYHETITRFWIHKVSEFIRLNKNKTLYGLEELVKKSQLMNKEYILKFYTQNQLDSPEYRAVFM